MWRHVFFVYVDIKMKSKGKNLTSLVHILPDQSLYEGIQILNHFNIHRLPVMQKYPENTVLCIINHQRLLRFMMGRVCLGFDLRKCFVLNGVHIRIEWRFSRGKTHTNWDARIHSRVNQDFWPFFVRILDWIERFCLHRGPNFLRSRFFRMPFLDGHSSQKRAFVSLLVWRMY